MGTDKKVVTYHDRVTPVQLGDHVETRVWFRRYRGRVAYVPGISPPNPFMERDGMCWVGVRLEEGGFVSSTVDPEGFFLLRKEKLLRRDADNVPTVAQDEDPHRGDSFPSI